MKRMIVAGVLLVLVAFGCTGSILLQKYNEDHLLNMLDDIQEAYDAGNRTQCAQLTQQFSDEYVRRTEHFPLFMRHADLSKVEEIAVALPVILAYEGDTHFPSELVRCRNQLEKLSQLEMPTFDNIL